MYAYVDHPVGSVCNSGRFLLWAMRGWGNAIEHSICPLAALSRGFAGVCALHVLPEFHLALALINKHGREPISLAPMNCPHIVEHEAVLLALWRDLSIGAFDNVKATLALLVTETAVSPVSRAMTMVTAKLIAAGFDLSGLTPAPMKEIR